MGFDLGLMAAAYHGAKKAERQARDDEFTDRVRAYKLGDLQEEADLRPERMDAARSDYRERVGVNESRARTRPYEEADKIGKYEADATTRPYQTQKTIAAATRHTNEDVAENELIPQKTANAKVGLQVATAENRGKLGRLPKVEKARDLRAANDIVKAETEGVDGETGLQVARANNTMAPSVISQKYATNMMSEDQARVNLLAGIAEKIDGDDTQGAIRNLNDMLADPVLSRLFPPHAKGKTVAAIEEATAEDGATKTFRIKDSEGGMLSEIPASVLVNAYKSASRGKGEMQRLGDGQQLVWVHNGRARVVAENQKDFGATGLGGSKDTRPREQKVYEWRRELGDTHEQATAYTKQSVSLSKPDFIRKALVSHPTYNYVDDKKKREIMADLERMYDDVQVNAAPSASNNSGARTFTPDPRFDFVRGK